MIKQKLIDIFIIENQSEPVTKNYDTNEFVVKHFDNIWILASLDMIDYGS